MLVAKFWSKHKETIFYQKNGKKRQITIERWGFSNDSQSDAKNVAIKRVEQAKLEWLNIQEKTPENFWDKWKREPKVPYNGADIPIREEIIEDKGNDVLTRNSYGAICLNTKYMFIADIDKENLSFRIKNLNFYLFLIFSSLAYLFLNQYLSHFYLGLIILLSIPLSLILKSLFWKLYVLYKGGYEKIIEYRLKFYQDLSFKVYKTPNGFRVIETSKPFIAESSFTQDLFRALQVDKIYAKMCKKQKCFRARLTGKPWRMNIEKMPHGIWPIEDKIKLEKRLKWIERYNSILSNFSPAKFLFSVNKEITSLTIEKTLSWHDSYLSNKPLA